VWYRGSNEAGTIVPSSYSLLWFLFYVRFIVFVQAHRRREEGFLLAESCWIVVAPRFYATKKLQSVCASGFFLW
jgi:hypothetical protein